MSSPIFKMTDNYTGGAFPFIKRSAMSRSRALRFALETIHITRIHTYPVSHLLAIERKSERASLSALGQSITVTWSETTTRCYRTGKITPLAHRRKPLRRDAAMSKTSLRLRTPHVRHFARLRDGRRTLISSLAAPSPAYARARLRVATSGLRLVPCRWTRMRKRLATS